jgi:hypothetical protein
MPPKKKATEAPAPVAEDVPMAEAPTAAAQALEAEDDGEQLVVGEQRVRVVSFMWSAGFRFELLITVYSFQEICLLQHHLNSRTKIILWEMHCDISS